MNITYLSAMVRTTAANAIWLQNTAPLWVFLFGTTVLRDPIHPRDWLQLGFIAAGLAVILSFELQAADPTGVLWGLGAGVTYAGVVLSLRWLRGEDAAWLVAVNHGFTALALLPYVLLTGPAPTALQLVVLAGFGALQMGIPYMLFARSVRALPAHEATGIVLLEPILMPTWVWLVGVETPKWWTSVGGALIFLGLVARYLRTANSASRE
jgi:drug/metabolite transporter (DMT)-like permease